MNKTKISTTYNNNNTKRIKNWSNYSKSLEKHGDITVLVNAACLQQAVRPTGRAGRPYEYPDEIILLLAQIRELFRLPLRQTIGVAKAIFRQAGLDVKLPGYVTLSRRFGKLNIPLVQHRNMTSKLPVIFLPDSTGLKVSGEGEWKVKKHGAGGHRKWVKAHIGTDYTTRMITAVKITNSVEHDGKHLSSLIRQTKAISYNIANIIADGAYDSHSLYIKTIKQRINLIVPPPKHARFHGYVREGELVDDKGWEKRNTYVRECKKLGKSEWKKRVGYHKRSLAETTMSRLKITFGDKLKSKKRKNQIAETRVRILLLNLFTSYGLPQYTG